MRRTVATAAVGVVMVSTLTACNGSDPGPDPEPTSSPTTTAETPEESEVAQHETGAESPIAYGLVVPEGATQLGPLVSRRSPKLIAAYEKVVKRYEKQRAREHRQEGEPPPTTTPTEPYPTHDSYSGLEEPPESDITTALLRVDGRPGKVFQAILTQVAEIMPGIGVDPERWSQYCTAKNGWYTGCKLEVSGRTVEDRGVHLTITLDPGNVETMTAPAGSAKRPVMTVTTESTDPIDTSDALQNLPTPPSPSTTPTPSPPSPSPIAPGPTVEAKWPQMEKVAPTGPGSRLLADRWSIRKSTTLLLSGRDPAFAILVGDRETDADAVTRNYARRFTSQGGLTRNVVEDRTQITITYRAKRENGPAVTAAFVQSGRGKYIVLFRHPGSSN